MWAKRATVWKERWHHFACISSFGWSKRVGIITFFFQSQKHLGRKGEESNFFFLFFQCGWQRKKNESSDRRFAFVFVFHNQKKRLTGRWSFRWWRMVLLKKRYSSAPCLGRRGSKVVCKYITYFTQQNKKFEQLDIFLSYHVRFRTIWDYIEQQIFGSRVVCLLDE